MVIPRTLTADEYKTAPPEDQEHYVEGEEGGYVYDPVAKLRRAKDHEVARRNSVIKERDLLQKRVDEFEAGQRQKESDAFEKEKKNVKDLEQLEQMLNAKHQQELKSRDDILEQFKTRILSQYQEKIINEVTKNESLPEYEHVVKLLFKDRIKAEFNRDNEPTHVIYDLEGNPTKFTLEDLTKEIRGDKRNSNLLKGADLGSGATSSPKAEPAVPSSPRSEGDRKKDFERFMKGSPQDVVEHLRSQNLLGNN